MTTRCRRPLNIRTGLDTFAGNTNCPLYRTIIQGTLESVLPEKFFDLYDGSASNAACKDYFNSLFPLARKTITETFPSSFSYVILFKYRANAFKFCFEMISRWLIPGRRLNVELVYAVDFSVPEMGDELYTFFELIFRVENRLELEEIQRNFPTIETEIFLGLNSSYYARRILEIKGLSNDEKTAMIQEYVTYMTSRRPRDFSYDLFAEMQHVLVVCRDEFKIYRSVRHLSRMICVQYLFRKALKKAVLDGTDKRHLFLKIYPSLLTSKGIQKPVLGLIVGVNFMREKELLEQTHLIKAIRNHIPEVQAVPGSFFTNRRESESFCTLYMEVEKTSGESFSTQEIRLLTKELPTDLEGRIERPQHTVFMPRNEEEVMRNILTLSQQIKFVRDIPQVIISFDEQTHTQLYFTIILVRLVQAQTPSVPLLFQRLHPSLEFTLDRNRIVGHLRKKHSKEAVVFRLGLPKEQFLRRDHSIDLYKARQAVVSAVSDCLGSIRDYNGGMISKQNELLSRVKELLKSVKKYDELLLENFFYSLNPVMMRSVLEPEEVKKLFLMLQNVVFNVEGLEDAADMKVRAEPNAVYVVVVVSDNAADEEIKRLISASGALFSAIASATVNIQDRLYLGYIYRCDDSVGQRKFCTAIQTAVSLKSMSEKT